MEYTLIFIFDHGVNQVLLRKKSRGPYPNHLNGLGGKLEPGERPMQGAIREMAEECGITIDQCISFTPLMTLTYPNLDRTVLHVFWAHLMNGCKITDPDPEEPNIWCPVGELRSPLPQRVPLDFYDVRNPIWAGEGSVPYFIYSSLTAMGKEQYAWPRKGKPHEEKK